MGFFNWISSHKKANSSGVKRKDKLTVDKALATLEEMKGLEKYAVFLKNYVQVLIDTELDIETEISVLTSDLEEILDEEKLIKEIWIYRYANLYRWFFEIKPPRNTNDVNNNLLLINWALKRTLEENRLSDYLPWLEAGITEYTGTEEVNFLNVEEFKARILDMVAEKLASIPREFTCGKFEGELFDGVQELIMRTMEEDRNSFYLEESRSLTEEQKIKIKDGVQNMKLAAQQYTKEIFEDWLGEELK